jgi:hypothetical protein
MQADFVELSRINSSGVPERTKAHGVLARKRLRVSEARGLTSSERVRVRDPPLRPRSQFDSPPRLSAGAPLR